MGMPIEKGGAARNRRHILRTEQVAMRAKEQARLGLWDRLRGGLRSELCGRLRGSCRYRLSVRASRRSRIHHDRVVSHAGKIKHHLVDLAIAIPAHGNDAVSQRIQHSVAYAVNFIAMFGVQMCVWVVAPKYVRRIGVSSFVLFGGLFAAEGLGIALALTLSLPLFDAGAPALANLTLIATGAVALVAMLVGFNPRWLFLSDAVRRFTDAEFAMPLPSAACMTCASPCSGAVDGAGAGVSVAGAGVGAADVASARVAEGGAGASASVAGAGVGVAGVSAMGVGATGIADGAEGDVSMTSGSVGAGARGGVASGANVTGAGVEYVVASSGAVPFAFSSGIASSFAFGISSGFAPGLDAPLSTGEELASIFEKTAGELQSRYGLTERETQIAALLLAGRSRPFIRDELVISLNTVHAHARNIYSKCGVHSQQEFMDFVHLD